MDDSGFMGAIEEAKKLEKKILEYSPYGGEVFIEKTMDLEPREYVDLGYADMINMYERSQKIISTAGLGILASKGAAAPEATAETGEVESKLREITSQSLAQAEEVGKEPIVLENAPPPEPEPEKSPEPSLALEFETKPAEEVAAAPPRKEAELEIETEKPAEEEKRPEAPPQRAPPSLMEERAEPTVEKKVVVAVPPVLRESPDQAASKRYEQMQEQIKTVVGERADEATIKKKMLELTKQLFKEKSFNKREEIKVQITALKNMLASAQAGGGAARPAAAAAKKGGADEAHNQLFETMLNTHQSEIAQTKDNITDSYNKQISSIKKKFYEDISSTEDGGKRKQIFEAFVFSVTSLVEQLPEVIKRYNDFTAKKHKAELDKLRGSLSAEEKDLNSRVKERLDYIAKSYEKEFSSVKGIVGRDIENLIEVAGTEIFKKPEEKPKETEERIYETVKEINDTDEGTLLYFLHNKDPDFYKKYERKLLSKSEAIFKAKELMAKEKGLGESVVKKYFTQVEG